MSSVKNGFNGANTNAKQADKFFIGRAIRAPKILCIDGVTGENLGIMQTNDALKLAADKSLDLVQIQPPANGKPPTCKIMDYGKFRYDESKKQKASEKRRRETEVKLKEIKIRPVTDPNDLDTKARKATEFINEGCRVKITVFHLNWREMSFKDVTQRALQSFLSMIPNTVAGQITTEGKNVSVIVEKSTTKRQIQDQ